MEYRAVGKLCAIALEEMGLPISREEALTILKRKGFEALSLSVVSLARQQIGLSQYRCGAPMSKAPAVVDCSGLVKWLYAQIGLWLPRRAIQQRDYGRLVTPHRPIAGDLIFASGANDYYDHDPADGVGHVGLATGDDTVIHVTSGTNVIEAPLLEYVEETRLRGIRRYLLTGTETLTLQVPEGLEIETADDIRWIILQSLLY